MRLAMLQESPRSFGSTHAQTASFDEQLWKQRLTENVVLLASVAQMPAGSATDVQSAFAAMGGGATAPRRAPKTGTTPPTIVFHGDADATVHIVNGERVLAAAGVTACDDVQRGVSASGVPYTRRIWVGGQGAERGEQWTIHGAGHAWSGGDLAGSYTDPRGPDASAQMLRFFLAHPKG